jgi:IS5 family transposase
LEPKEARMRPSKKEPDGTGDLFRARLDQIINMKHALVRLADEIDWEWIDEELAVFYRDKGRPAVPTRFMVGLLLLKHIYGLSDEGVCERWVHDPYFQYFTGETFFQHELPHERSGLSHWRQRIGDRLEVLLAESLRVAHDVGALKKDDLARITVDTTVQPKNVTHPTDAKLMLTAIRKLGEQAKAEDVPLRQSYLRIAKRAAVMAGRYAHAKQFKRCNRELRFLRTRLGRLVRDIRRKTEDDPALEAAFAGPLGKAMQIRGQRQNRRGWKLSSWHAPETECIGKGKAHRPYEFGCKVSIATTNRRCKGGQFVVHAKALHGNPYDGHTLRQVIEETQALTGREVERAYVDKGYRGHDAPKPLRVFRSGQRRGVHGQIKRELRRRAAIEAVIGHMKTDGHLGRNFLKGRDGDRANALLTAVGYNLRLILQWLRLLLRKILAVLLAPFSPQPIGNPPC